MKTNIATLILLLLVLSCGNGNEPGEQAVQAREVSSGFTGIESSGAYNIIVADGPADGKISLEGDSKILDKIKVEVKGKTLKISQKSGFYKSNGKSVRISLKAQNISSLLLAGSGNITAEGIQKVNDFEAVIDGSGNIGASVISKNTVLQLNGSGSMNISGKTDRLRAGIAGSGDIHAFELKANDVNVGMSGSGNLEIHSDHKLKAGVTGSGKLYYRGNPSDTDFHTAGSGEVIEAN